MKTLPGRLLYYRSWYITLFHVALQEEETSCLETCNASAVTQNTVQKYYSMFDHPLYLLALVDSLAVVLLDSLVFFFCWVAEGFRSSCSSGSGAGGSLWSASELPLLVLGLSSSDLCLSLDIVGNFLGKEKKRSRVNTRGRTLFCHFPSSTEHLNRWQLRVTEKLTKMYFFVLSPRVAVWQLQSNIYISENTDISNF